MLMFYIRCRWNRFRSLSLLSPIVLRYGVFNRLISDSALFLVFDAPCISSETLFHFLSQKLYHRFNSERKCTLSFAISLWCFSNKIVTAISRLQSLANIIDGKIAKISIWFLSFTRYSSWELSSRNGIARLLL